MASVIRLQSSKVRSVFSSLTRRLISTSKKNSETISVSAENKVEKISVGKNWISYGFDRKSESADRNMMHAVFFASVTLCIVFGGFFMAYVPDYNLRDWAQREAFLELRRREAKGLPLVDPNLIDPKKITLPSDEELGDAEIII